MTDTETFDPADQLRADIESAIAGQHEEPAIEAVEAPETKPVDESIKGEDGRERDAQGRFVAKAEDVVAEEPKEPKEPGEPKLEPAASEAAKTDTRPPPGFSIASKAAWDKEAPTPEEWAAAKADIAKREQEVDNGFKRYSGLGKFAEEAERNGTTLQNALTDYAGIETALRQNFLGGIEFICKRMNIDPHQLAQHMAVRYNMTQVDPTTQAAHVQPQIDPTAIAEHAANVIRQEFQQRDLNSQIESFKADPKNKFFANVREDMAKLVQAGKAETLKEAYEAACWLNPETRAILINEANGGRNKEAAVAVSKSRNAAKAVGGSPAPGINPDVTGKRQNLSTEDEIRAAIDAQMGAA